MIKKWLDNRKTSKEYYAKGVSVFDENPTEALEYFNKILEIDPKNKESANKKATALFRLQQYQQGQEFCIEFLKRNPNYVNMYFWEGLFLYQIERYLEALPFLNIAFGKRTLYLGTEKRIYSLGDIPLEREFIDNLEYATTISALNVFIPDYNQINLESKLETCEPKKENEILEKISLMYKERQFFELTNYVTNLLVENTFSGITTKNLWNYLGVSYSFQHKYLESIACFNAALLAYKDTDTRVNKWNTISNVISGYGIRIDEVFSEIVKENTRWD